MDESESYAESDDEQNSSTPEVRITRANRKEKASKADFSQLKALRQKKAEKTENITDSQDGKSSSFKDFINSVVSREVGHKENPKESESLKSQKSGSVYRESTENSSDRAEISSCFHLVKRIKIRGLSRIERKNTKDRNPRERQLYQ